MLFTLPRPEGTTDQGYRKFRLPLLHSCGEVTQSRSVVSYRRFGTTYWLKRCTYWRPTLILSSQMCLDISSGVISLGFTNVIFGLFDAWRWGANRLTRNVSNYKSKLCNIPEDRIFRLRFIVFYMEKMWLSYVTCFISWLNSIKLATKFGMCGTLPTFRHRWLLHWVS